MRISLSPRPNALRVHNSKHRVRTRFVACHAVQHASPQEPPAMPDPP